MSDEFKLCKIFENEFYFHPYFELVFCKSGSMKLEYIKYSITITTGDCVLIPPYVIHKFCGTNYDCDKMLFSYKKLSCLYSKQTMERYMKSLEKFSCCIINNEICKAVFDELSHADINEKNSFLLVAELISLFDKQTQACNKNCIFQKNKKFSELINYIDDNMPDYLSTNSISEKFNLTSSHIGYIFKTQIGIPPVTYITNIKLATSAKMLSVTSKNIKSVCSSCGFKSNIYFQNIFKEAFGITPRQYQKLFQII